MRRRRRSAWQRMRRLALWLLAGGALISVSSVLLLRWVEPPVSAVMLARLAVEGRPQVHIWTDLNRIDPHAALAVVAAEDQRFPEHWGLDTREIVAAVEAGMQGGRPRGASTISQQVARNLFLWQGRSYLRKGLEVWFTGLVELLWPKRRILEMYLNFAETGERLFGFPAAARHYFGRSPARLGARRSALLAAILPNPLRLRADRPSAYVISRRDWILEQMSNLGGTAYLRNVMAQ